MENDNNKTCAKSYRPGSAVCLECGENEETVEQYLRCQKMYKSLDDAHEILEGVGLDAESRTCLLQKRQLVAVALLAEQDKTLGGLSKTTLNKLAKENRLLEIAQAHAKGIMTVLNAHQILKDLGLDVDSRNCLAKNKQLIDIAKLVIRNREYLGSDKKTFIDLANKLAMKNRINDLTVVIENSMWLTESDLTTMVKSLQGRAQKVKTIIEILPPKSRKKRIEANLNNIIKGVYKEYISNISQKKIRKKVLTKKWTGVKQGWQLRKVIRYVRCKRKLNAEPKGSYIGNILSQCNYLLTHDQLGTMMKKFELTAKNIAELCEIGKIYRQEQNGTFLYASSEYKFEQNWDSQIEYFSELFNKRGFAKTNRLISYLVESALLEKGWLLDEIYVSILISKTLQIPANAYENITEKKRKDKLVSKDNLC